MERKTINPEQLAHFEEHAPQTYPPLASETRTHINTSHAGHLLGRKNQTMRIWACLENGPIRPIRVNGRLAWPVADIKRLLGVA